MPTSITVAPGLTNSGVTRPDRADRRHQDVGLAADRRQVRRPRVADGHGGVAVQQQQRHRLADDVAAADDDGVRAGDRDALALEHLDDAGRRAGDQLGTVLRRAARRSRRRIRPRPSSAAMASNTCCCAPAPIAFGSGDCTRMPSWTGAARSGGRPMPARRRASRSSGSRSRSTRKPTSVPAFTLLRDVDLRGGVLADEHDAQAGRPPVRANELGHLRGNLGLHADGQALSIEHTSSHRGKWEVRRWKWEVKFEGGTWKLQVSLKFKSGVGAWKWSRL